MAEVLGSIPVTTATVVVDDKEEMWTGLAPYRRLLSDPHGIDRRRQMWG